MGGQSGEQLGIPYEDEGLSQPTVYNSPKQLLDAFSVAEGSKPSYWVSEMLHTRYKKPHKVSFSIQVNDRTLRISLSWLARDDLGPRTSITVNNYPPKGTRVWYEGRLYEVTRWEFDTTLIDNVTSEPPGVPRGDQLVDYQLSLVITAQLVA